jgi:hypothetical protein
MTNILTKNLDITDFFMNDELDKIAEISENLSENSKTTVFLWQMTLLVTVIKILL